MGCSSDGQGGHWPSSTPALRHGSEPDLRACRQGRRLTQWISMPPLTSMRGAGDVGGEIRGQEEADPATSSALPRRSSGMLLRISSLHLVGQLAAGDVGLDQSGRYAVDADVVRAELARHRLGEAEHAGLGGASSAGRRRCRRRAGPRPTTCRRSSRRPAACIDGMAAWLSRACRVRLTSRMRVPVGESMSSSLTGWVMPALLTARRCGRRRRRPPRRRRGRPP